MWPRWTTGTPTLPTSPVASGESGSYPVWVGRSRGAVSAWTRYESMLNLAFASSPATILCPYDMRAVSANVVADAYRTHPQIMQGTNKVASHTYREPEDFLLD